MKTCPTCNEGFEDVDAAFCPEDGSVLLDKLAGGTIDLRIGTRIEGYILSEVIADGGMGRVYKAYHPESRERRAVKILHQKVARDPVNVERFRREYESSSELEHPYLVRAYDFGDTPDGSHYLLMEFLEGEPLSDSLLRQHKFPLEQVLRYGSQLAIALGHTHGAGLVHRDLKPENIFLRKTSQGVQVCLLDFGSAKNQMEMGERLTAIGTTLGSPAYMSPEQASGERDIDQRTDIFALGAILHEMLGGEVAFAGDSMADILNRVVRADYVPLQSVAAPVSAAVAQAMHVSKHARPQSAEDYLNSVIASAGLHERVAEVADISAEEIGMALAMAPPPAMMAATERPAISSNASESPSSAPKHSPHHVSANLPLRGSEGIMGGLMVAGLAVLLAAGAAVAYFLSQP